jgi:hypothetical protein
MHPASDSATDLGWCRDRRGWPLAWIGLVLIASGLAHAILYAVVGGPWEGAVSWRKPILFGISGGLTSLSLGWVWAHLRWRRGDGVLAVATAWALLVEVALIDLQRWRGVASHFNRQTAFDSFVYDAMGALILFVSIVAADLMIRCFRQPTSFAPEMLLAARAGLVLLVISCLLGIWVGIYGDMRTAAGLPAEVYGTAGVPKFPHGAVIHALQWLPLLAWLARQAAVPERLRRPLVASASTGSALVGVYALLQTLAGRARFDASPGQTLLLTAGILLLALPALVIAGWWLGSRRRRQSPAAG